MEFQGNTRAAVHGAKSEPLLKPVREQHIVALREAYPLLDDRRLVLLADRLARIDLATAWLQKQRGVVRTRDGEVYPVVKELEKWAARAEQVLKDAEHQHRGSAGRVDLAQSMAALEEGEGA